MKSFAEKLSPNIHTVCVVFGHLIDKTYVWTVLSTHLFNDDQRVVRERNRNSCRLYCTNDKDIYWKTADDRASLLSYIGQNPSFAVGHPTTAIEVLSTVDDFHHKVLTTFVLPNILYIIYAL